MDDRVATDWTSEGAAAFQSTLYQFAALERCMIVLDHAIQRHVWRPLSPGAARSQLRE
jgi:hypothetical protein